MINALLEYNFKTLEVDKSLKDCNIIKAVDLNSFDHDNYKKDENIKNKLESNYYGKKRRYYTDYC